MNCFACQKDLGIRPGDQIGRREECPHCGADVHVCKNCRHYDVSAYNECRETQADRVLDKDRSNFCDYFSANEKQPGSTLLVDPAEEAKKKLAELFKR